MISEKTKEILLRLVSRKFLLTMCTLVSVHWLMNYKMIDDSVYSTVMIATVAVYVSGNVTQKIKVQENENKDTK